MRSKTVATVATIAGLLFLASAATGAEAKKGFFFSIDGASMTPGNVNTPILATVPNNFQIFSTANTSSNTTWMEFDSSMAGTLSFGYAFGEMGSLSVSYWNYADDSGSTGSFDGSNEYYSFFGIGPAATFGYYPAAAYPVTWDFAEELDATAIDLEFKRSHGMGENLNVTWGVGLRVANFEDQVEGAYAVDFDGAVYQFPASRSVEGDAFGFTASVGTDYAFNDHFGLGTALRVGFLNTDVDASHSMVDQDAYYLTYGAEWREDNRIDDEVSNTIDFDFNLAFRVNEMISLDLGYQYATWSDIAASPLGRTTYRGTNPNFFIPTAPFPGETRERISWSGPRLRLKFALDF